VKKSVTNPILSCIQQLKNISEHLYFARDAIVFGFFQIIYDMGRIQVSAFFEILETRDNQEELNRSAVLRGKSLRATFW